MSENIFERLGYMGIKRDVSMAAYTSFRTGGRAAAFVEPSDTDELADAIQAAGQAGMQYFVMGNGTNLLVSDRGTEALVIRLGERFAGINCSGNVFCARAGGLLGAFARYTVDEGFMGLEWAAGIPGSVGGAVAMNAGAYGGEIKQVLTGVTYYDNGIIRSERPALDSLGYRKSAYCAPQRVVIEAEFTLLPDDGGTRARMEDHSRRRREKQPLMYPSAGSTFKRPEGHFAGALIEAAGLKGRSVGGAQVSTLHAGFIINAGGATSSDVYSLICTVRDEVYRHSGIMLETEVKLLGEF